MLSPEGLNRRKITLQTLAETYNKSAHHDALDSLNRLKQSLPVQTILTFAWVADALQQSLSPKSIDLIMCDVPYGGVTHWHSQHEDNLISRLLKAQYKALANDGIVAIISDKKQRAIYPNYIRLQENTIGKRRILILQKLR